MKSGCRVSTSVTCLRWLHHFIRSSGTGLRLMARIPVLARSRRDQVHSFPRPAFYCVDSIPNRSQPNHIILSAHDTSTFQFSPISLRQLPYCYGHLNDVVKQDDFPVIGSPDLPGTERSEQEDCRNGTWIAAEWKMSRGTGHDHVVVPSFTEGWWRLRWYFCRRLGIESAVGIFGVDFHADVVSDVGAEAPGIVPVSRNCTVWLEIGGGGCGGQISNSLAMTSPCCLSRAGTEVGEDGAFVGGLRGRR